MARKRWYVYEVDAYGDYSAHERGYVLKDSRGIRGFLRRARRRAIRAYRGSYVEATARPLRIRDLNQSIFRAFKKMGV